MIHFQNCCDEQFTWRRHIFLNIHSSIVSHFRKFLLHSFLSILVYSSLLLAPFLRCPLLALVGGFLNWGYLQVIHLNGILPHKPSILGYFLWTSIYGNHQFGSAILTLGPLVGGIRRIAVLHINKGPGWRNLIAVKVFTMLARAHGTTMDHSERSVGRR